MSKFFQKLKKIITAKKTGKFFNIAKKILKTLLVLLVIYIIAIVAFRETVKTLDYFIHEEQKRDLVRFEDKLKIAGEHLKDLETALQLPEEKTNQPTQRAGRKYYPKNKTHTLNEEQKKQILKTAWELRKDSWRLESAWLNHQNDLSTTFYPRKDEQVEEQMKEYWRSHLLINRLVDDAERIVYDNQNNAFLLKQFKTDFQEAINLIEKASKK